MLIKAKDYKHAEVKPCPFCGERENIIIEEYDHAAGKRWRIFCAECMGGVDRGWDQSPSGPVEAWNKRETR